jgi:four helix bundle protein
MDAEEFKSRTKAFAIRVIQLAELLPNGKVFDIISKQLIRSGTSVGANYRAACRARSRAEFVAKIGIVEEEADETIYWLEMLIDHGRIPSDRILPVIAEARQILAMVIASIRTARGNRS